MSAPLIAFDVLLGVAVLAAAGLALFLPRREPAVVLFLVFGLLLAATWARLGAPDIALAEAAIGAGVTTALLLDTVRHTAAPPPAARRAGAALAGLPLGAVLAAGLLLAALTLRRPPGLAEEAAAALPGSGVEHPVTAVLLNFRAYDTLLEVAVLLVAALAALSLHPGGALRQVPVPPPAPPVLDALVRVLTPLAVVLGGWLLVAGSTRPGGAFQAGALLAGALVLLRLAGYPAGVPTGRWLVPALTAGLAAFVLLAVATALLRAGWLDLDPAWAGAAILAVEAAVTVSIAVALAALYVAGWAPGTQDPP